MESITDFKLPASSELGEVEDKSQVPHHNRTKKFVVFLLSIVSCAVFAAMLDIYLFKVNKGGLSIDSIDLILGYDRYDAAITLEGDLQLHSYLSSYELVDTRISVKYSDDGKATFDGMTDALVTIESVGGYYDTGVKIFIAMTDTDYDRVGTFMWDALNGGTPFTYIEATLTYTIKANVFFGIPVLLKDVSRRKVIPLNKDKIRRYEEAENWKEENEGGLAYSRSLSSVDFYEEFLENLLSISVTDMIPFDFQFDGVSNHGVGVIASVNKKNPLKFLRHLPSVEIHIPAVTYSFSMIGNDQDSKRYRVSTEELTVEIADEDLDFSLSVDVECSDRDENNEKCNLVQIDYLNTFYDRLRIGNVDVVLDADEDNYITKMLGSSYSVGMSVTSQGDRRLLTDNSTAANEPRCLEVKTFSMVAEICINDDANSLAVTGTLQDSSHEESYLNITFVHEWDDLTSDHKVVDLSIYFFDGDNATVHGVAHGEMDASHLVASGSFVESVGSTSNTEFALAATYSSAVSPIDFSLDASFIHEAKGTTNGTFSFLVMNQTVSAEITNHDAFGSELFYGRFDAGQHQLLTSTGSGLVI